MPVTTAVRYLSTTANDSEAKSYEAHMYGVGSLAVLVIYCHICIMPKGNIEENTSENVDLLKNWIYLCYITINSHDYTAPSLSYESINSETKHRKSLILPTLSPKFGMYN